MIREINSFEDIESLIDNQIPEDLTLDYKRQLPDFSNNEKKLAFLKDICAFGNSSGGQLIYGIEEIKGKGTPKDILGIDIPNPDDTKIRILDVIKSGLDLRIAGVRVDIIAHKKIADKYIVIIKIPQSWNAPHWVAFDGYHKFYARASCKNYELSIIEIRDKINMMGNIQNNIKDFRNKRIDAIASNNASIHMQSGPRIILHIIPLSSFAANREIDVQDLVGLSKASGSYSWFSPFASQGYNTEITLEGLITISTGSEPYRAYTHFYRNGIVEAVSSLILGPKNLLPAVTYEKYLIKQNYLEVLNALEFTGPIFIFLSLVDVNGCFLQLGLAMTNIEQSQRSYKDKCLLLREIVADNFGINNEVLFRPVFDRICNAFGFIKSPHFDKSGKFLGN